MATGDSLNKITSALFQTSEYKALTGVIRERIMSGKLTRIFGKVDYNNKPRLYAEVDFGCTKYVASEEHFYSVYLMRDYYATNDELKAVFDANFGVKKNEWTKKLKVPTYNVNRDKALEHFSNAVGANISEVLKTEILIVTTRLTSAIKAEFANPENESKRQDAHDDVVIERILNTLKPFKNIRDEVLRRAFDTYICSVITDE